MVIKLILLLLSLNSGETLLIGGSGSLVSMNLKGHQEL